MVKIILHGAYGFMCQTIVELANKRDDIKIVAGIDNSIKSINYNFNVFKSLKDCNIDADVVIDFSNFEAVDNLLDYCKNKKLPVVICTTSLKKETLNKINEYSKIIPIIKADNTSVGVNIFTKIIETCSKFLIPKGYDVEIIEKHHRYKLDAPSGTAMMLANSINKMFNNKFKYVYNRSDRIQKRSNDEIGISQVRAGTIVGEHEVIFANQDDVITLKHTAYSKKIFANGSIDAAIFLKDKSPKLYDMKDVMFL